MQPGPPAELAAQSPPPELFAGGPGLEPTPLPISDCGPPAAGEELLELHDVEDVAARIRLRWMTASFLVAVMHVGTAYAVLNWPDPPLPSGEPPAAIMIELAPMPVAPETPPQEVAVGEQSLVSEQSTPSEQSETEPTETEVDKTETQTEPTPEPAEKIEEPVEQAEADIPKLAPAPDADAVPPIPAKEPQKEEPVEAKKPEPAEKKEPEKPKPEKQESRPQPKSSEPSAATAAPKPVTAPRAKTNAAPSPGTSSSQSMASWRGMVVAKINRHKRHPGGSAGGTSSVAFTIDRSGRVLSARLIRSSGSKALDAEAVALARRASPVPPPPNVGGSSIVLAVPIRFSR